MTNVKDDNDVSRSEARENAAEFMRPGQIVSVVLRKTLTNMASYNAPSPRYEKVETDCVHTWISASSARIGIDTIGPTWHLNERLLIISLLPSVFCEIYGYRPWALLMGGNSEFGWTFELDAFKIIT